MAKVYTSEVEYRSLSWNGRSEGDLVTVKLFGESALKL